MAASTGHYRLDILLFGNDRQYLAIDLHSKSLKRGLEFKHLLNIAGDELSDLIHQEEHGVVWGS